MLILNFYTIILIYVILSLIVVVALYSISYLLSAKKISFQKLSTYECGFEPINSAHLRFNIKFYIVALLFIIFDLEIVFLLPWVTNADNLGLGGYVRVSFFLIVLIWGFIYEYLTGALEW